MKISLLWAAVFAPSIVVGYLKLCSAVWRRATEHPKPESNSPDRLEWVGLFAVVCGFLALQIPSIQTGFQYDELLSVVHFVVGKSFWESASRQFVFNNHFANSVQLNLVGRVLGYSEWALRFPSIFWGIVSIVVTWAIARRRAGRVAAIGTALLLGLSPLFVELSRQARGYAGLTAMSLISTYCFLLMIGGKAERRIWICHAAALALGVYFHLYGIWTISAQCCIAAWLLYRRSNDAAHRKVWVSLAVGSFLAFVLYLPAVIKMWLTMGERGRTPINWHFPVELISAMRGGPPGIVASGIAALVIIGALRVSRGDVVYLVAWIGIPLVAVWLLVRPTDLYPRFFVYWMPAFCYLVMQGILACRKLFYAGAMGKLVGSATVLVVVWTLVGWTSVDLRTEREDYRAGLRMRAMPQRQFAAGSDTTMFRYYLPEIRQLSLTQFERELAVGSFMQVAYHDVPWNSRDDVALAAKLNGQCAVSRRDRVLMFSCNQTAP